MEQNIPGFSASSAQEQNAVREQQKKQAAMRGSVLAQILTNGARDRRT
jgi:DNA-binding TFAR19-related protein (PDSD5 family)